MDDYPSPYPVRDRSETANISCDSCLRSTTKCLGGPICERCNMHGFECIFSPDSANIQDLKNAFSTLLMPGMERPRTPSPINGWWEESERRRSESEGVTGEGEIQVESEGKPRLHTCTTCEIWNSPHCDLRTPTCSSCLVRDVECVYESLPMDIAGHVDYNHSRASESYSTTPSRNWQTQTPSLPPSVAQYYGETPPPINQSSKPKEKSRQKARSKSRPKSRPSSPPTYPLQRANMYSTPSGCTSCFSSKQKCIPNSRANKPCLACHAAGLPCTSFPPNTKLLACSSCTLSNKVCTNTHNGLICDNCAEAKLECSRTYSSSPPLPSYGLANTNSILHQPPLPQSINRGEGTDRRCPSCISLDLSCTHSGTSSGGCFPCREFGLVCTQSFDPISDPAIFARDAVDVDMKVQKAACITCQARQTKCDGRKPGCGRCESVGSRCEGYGSSSTTASVSGVASNGRREVGKGADAGLSMGDGVDNSGRNQHATENGGMSSEPVVAIVGKEEAKEDSEDWEEITHTDALPAAKPGEFGVLELDE